MKLEDLSSEEEDLNIVSFDYVWTKEDFQKHMQELKD